MVSSAKGRVDLSSCIRGLERRDLAESGGDRCIGLMVVINVMSRLCGNSGQ
jgi:hypothetical protein